MNATLKKKLQDIKLLALDFDGTLTYGGFVVFDQNGVEAVICSRRDSLGIDMLKKAGVDVVVISKETNPVVAARCKKMNLQCWSGVGTSQEKLQILKTYSTQQGYQQNQICYGGDDVNDIEELAWAGFSFTPADGHPACKKMADYTTKTNAGQGAVREVCELILLAKGRPVAS